MYTNNILRKVLKHTSCVYLGTLLEQPTLYNENVKTPENLQRYVLEMTPIFSMLPLSLRREQYVKHWYMVLSVVYPCVGLWKGRNSESSSSPLLWPMLVSLWTTLSWANPGWGVGLTTSCSGRAPSPNNAKQYVSPCVSLSHHLIPPQIFSFTVVVDRE